MKGVYQLKEGDKRLLEFLARGMTADDFEDFLDSVDSAISHIDRSDLIERLWEWRNTPTHDTPSNHCWISFEVKAPIFVRAQLVKHEYLIMSEFSRRYITDDIEFYEPDYWRKAAPNKKQGSLEESVENLNKYGDVSGESIRLKNAILSHFQNLLDAGVAPEQARMVLPSIHYD
jgi:thymidylate synthase (FAD)